MSTAKPRCKSPGLPERLPASEAKKIPSITLVLLKQKAGTYQARVIIQTARGETIHSSTEGTLDACIRYAIRRVNSWDG